MQRNVRIQDSQLVMLSDRARTDPSLQGYLHKRTADSARWQMRWFILYQNLLFYYENDTALRPSGLIFLEGCYCDHFITANGGDPDKQFCFTVSYRKENQRQYELKATSESQCTHWIDAIEQASFNKLLEQKVGLEQQHLHLVQMFDSVNSANCRYIKECEEKDMEIKKLHREVDALRKERKAPATPIFPQRPMVRRTMSHGTGSLFNAAIYDAPSGFSELYGITESFDMEKIKKVQSFLRGWLCRRRWKHIVEEYIKSPHAENMRERNRLVFQMVEAEEEYTEHLEVLVSCFLRPFKMAASSKKPPCSHEDVNSIFLNSETLLFLHQIFLKGLTSRMESWPTLVLGDLFDMLLPMLSIYQEYVRNHNYSLQILTERKHSSPSFTTLLTKLEKQLACRGRSLYSFLLYPMQQINKYVITLRALVDKTPHDHVELKSLRNAKQTLEVLSRQIHDEESVTENLRRNLSVERMIVQGCDILLDVNQVFVRQGALIQVLEKPKGARSRLNATFGKSNAEKEAVRKCFLFSYHLLLTTQDGDSGRLNLVPQIGRLALADIICIEDPSEQVATDDDELSVCSMSSNVSENSEVGSTSVISQFQNRDFKILLDTRTGGPQVTIHLVAPTVQEKTAWITDLNQCLDNVHYNGLHRGSLSDASSVTMPPSFATDPSMFNNDSNIRFGKILDSCKIPLIREAPPQWLLRRLTDFTFISIDFLNTFLLTYRVFTDGITVLEALKKVFYETEPPSAPILSDSIVSLDAIGANPAEHNLNDDRRRSSGASPRRTSAASSVSGYGSELSDCREARSHGSYDSNSCSHTLNSKGYWKSNHKKDEQQLGFISESPSTVKRSPTAQSSTASPNPQRRISIRVDKQDDGDSAHLTIPTVIAVSSSSETLTDNTVVSADSSPSNLSSVTLVGSSSDPSPQDGVPCSETTSEEPITPVVTEAPKRVQGETAQAETQTEHCGPLTDDSSTMTPTTPLKKDAQSQKEFWDDNELASTSTQYQTTQYSQCHGRHRTSVASCPSSRVRSGSISTITGSYWATKPGVVITSFREGQRSIGPQPPWSSTSSAATAFAIATSASSNPPDKSLDDRPQNGSCRDKSRRKESVMSTAATMRVLNVLRHWISKQAQDFERDPKLKALTVEFLDNIVHCPNLLQAEHKAASQLRRLVTKEEPDGNKVDLKILLTPPPEPTKESIETLTAMDIAEQMTYLDHKIFISIGSEEFLGQAWMKADKDTRAPNISLMTKRFNEVSQLVVSEIVRRTEMSSRVKAIEKWAAVADINRVLHNYNGVLQICAAFTNSGVYRLNKTWEKVSKTTHDTIKKLHNITTSDARFKNMRDALQKCDPPCIPFLGPYLTDLSFIEEAYPNFSENGYLNFAKMRKIAHVISEVRHFQQTPYKIKFNQQTANYLLDPSLLLNVDDVYPLSLEIQPRTRLSSATASSSSTK